MNPMEWDAPFSVIVAALFVIVMCRANATYWLGVLIARGAGPYSLDHFLAGRLGAR